MKSNDVALGDLNEKAKSPKDCFDIAAGFINNLEKNLNLQNPWVKWKRDTEKLGEEIYQNRDKPLSGVILGVKDIISTQEFPTGMGSENTWPNTNMGFDARVVAISKEMGAVVGGKTKTSEFAVHKETDVFNPKFPGRSPGTSSSGSAAAVANGTVDLALATQTAGSIARPSSYCGVIGFKPSFGDLPRTGVLKTTDDFDSLGIMAQNLPLLAEFYLTTRLTGADYPILEDRRRFTKIERAVILVGEGFDSSTEEISNLAQIYCTSNLDRLNFERVSPREFQDFNNIRDVHRIIYRRDLGYYFRSEIDSNQVSSDLADFIDVQSLPTPEEYQEAKNKLKLWREYTQLRFRNTLIMSLASSTSAPIRDSAYEYDLNAAITAAGFPQLCMPAFSDSEGRSVSMSLSGPKGSDKEILELGNRFLRSRNR